MESNQEQTVDELEEEVDKLFEENEYTFIEEKSQEIVKQADELLEVVDDWLKDDGMLLTCLNILFEYRFERGWESCAFLFKG